MLIYSKLFHTNLSYNDTICIYTFYRMYTKNYYPLTYTLNRTLPIHSISSLVQCMLYIYTLIIIHDIYIYILPKPFLLHHIVHTYVHIHMHMYIYTYTHNAIFTIINIITYNFLYLSIFLDLKISMIQILSESH